MGCVCPYVVVVLVPGPVVYEVVPHVVTVCPLEGELDFPHMWPHGPEGLPKKGNAKECSNYRTIALISHASKVMLKILQARLQ